MSCFQVNYDSATSASFKKLLLDDSSILLYAGDGGESYISTENANGMPEQLAKEELIEYLKSGKIVTSSEAATADILTTS